MNQLKENMENANYFLPQQMEIIAKNQSRLDFSRVKRHNVFRHDGIADCKENTDLFFYEFKRLRIACRVRFNMTSYDYGDVTIRSALPSGNDTEIDKINAGWGDYMLYCWEKNGVINEYIIIDLEEFRKRQNDFITVVNKWNFDNSSAFNCYSLHKILRTPCCIVAELKNVANSA